MQDLKNVQTQIFKIPCKLPTISKYQPKAHPYRISTQYIKTWHLPRKIAKNIKSAPIEIIIEIFELEHNLGEVFQQHPQGIDILYLIILPACTAFE